MKDYKYRKFTDEIEKNITEGLLKPGDRLPSVRKIKNEYQLSTSSVQNGYDYLVDKGLVKSIPRSGYRVNGQLKKKSAHSGRGLQAMYIALAVTTQPNDIIAVESPCVFSVLEVIANLGLRTVEIPVRNTTGMDLDFLEEACTQNNIRAIVATPNFHNPTGILMTDKAKKDLYGIASARDIPVIENDIYGDLYFSGTRPSNIRNLDTLGLVITVSSFSKSLAPGIRVGWLSAGRYFPQAERLKFALGRSVSPINQEVVIKLLSASGYDRHLRSFRRQLELQAVRLISHFNQYFPDTASATIPEGGYSTWVQLEPGTDMPSFYKTCEKFGVSFTPGHTFSFTNSYDHCFRAVFSSHLTAESFEAIEKTGNWVKE